MKPTIASKRNAFAALHQSGCFVLPNPWDAGSARYLQSLGFKALATTSSGFAWSRARADNAISRDMALAHLHDLVARWLARPGAASYARRKFWPSTASLMALPMRRRAGNSTPSLLRRSAEAP